MQARPQDRILQANGRDRLLGFLDRELQIALTNANAIGSRLEAQFSKQIDQINATLALTNSAMTQRLDDLKTHVSEISGSRQGSMQMVG